MKTIPYQNIQVSSMRKLALGAWKKPDDPSVNVQMDLDISTLMNTISKDQLKGALIKLFSIVLHEVPELNMVCIRGKLRQRLNNRIFIPTLIRDQRKIDLSGISIDNAYNLSLAAIKKEATNNISNLRSGKIMKSNVLFDYLR